MLVRELTLEEAQYLVEGAQILGTGGGGDPEVALKRVKEIYSQGKSFQIQEITEFSPNDMICIIGMVGGGVSSQDMKYIESLPITSDNVMIEAVKLLESHKKHSLQVLYQRRWDQETLWFPYGLDHF